METGKILMKLSWKTGAQLLTTEEYASVKQKTSRRNQKIAVKQRHHPEMGLKSVHKNKTI